MTFSLRSISLAAVVALVAGIAATASAGEGDIAYRQKVMSAVSGHMGAMVLILKGQGGDKADLAGHAHAMAELAKIVTHIFPEGSGPMDGKTAAKKEIWEKPTEFKAITEAFVRESAKLAKVAKTGDMAAFGAQIGALGKNACGACHKPFRQKK